jgi:carbon storage regulator
MLVLTRKKSQSLMIGDNIEITVIDVQDGQVKLGVSAPRDISIHRKEIYLEIREENKKASQINLDTLKKILKKNQ